MGILIVLYRSCEEFINFPIKFLYSNFKQEAFKFMDIYILHFCVIHKYFRFNININSKQYLNLTIIKYPKHH